MSNKGLLVVLSGPSGAGKDTVLSSLLARNNNIKISTSATTRKPRDGEVEGVDYYFMSKSEFAQLISKNGMLEHAEYCGNYYGTPYAQVEKWLSKGKDVILEIEVNGGAQVMKKCPDAISIFIVPPSLKELEMRLRNRATESDDVSKKFKAVIRNEVLSFSYTSDFEKIRKSLLIDTRTNEVFVPKTKYEEILGRSNLSVTDLLVMKKYVLLTSRSFVFSRELVNQVRHFCDNKIYKQRRSSYLCG